MVTTSHSRSTHADRPSCRVCLSEATEVVLDLGHHPLADRFLTPAMLDAPETYYPLRVFVCTACGYAGLVHVVSDFQRYVADDYSYTAGNSPVAIRHFDELALEIVSRVPTLAGQSTLAVDIGGNDGTLLAAIARQTGCRVLNVEASPTMAKLSQRNGVPVTDSMGFGMDVADDIRLSKGGADLIVTTNTLNHIEDVVPTLADVHEALKPGGMLVIEVPSVLELIRRRAWDTVYLEHVHYFTLRALADAIMISGNFAIEHAETVPYQGGSLRVWARKSTGNPRFDHVRTQIEAEPGPAELATAWRALGEHAARTRRALVQGVLVTNRLRRSIAAMSAGRPVDPSRPTVIAIGAAAKGNTLLNYCRLSASEIACVVDTSPHKIGKFTPGSHIPIVGDDDIPADATHAVILPWNIAGHMRERYAGRGLEIITPHELTDPPTPERP